MISFKKNMGTVDRTIRLLVGVILLTIGPATNLIELTPISEILLGVIGGFAVVSALFSYCLFYDLTGANTMSKSSSQE
ncbi:MAG: DUF2892 domain-containing protein [Gammaproteobacteria bacterium]|nr:DUF2892 domain-containing protein [Gammaproteobacteria bacterium]